MMYSELYAIIAPCQACSQQSMTWEYAFKISSTCFDNSGINMTSNKKDQDHKIQLFNLDNPLIISPSTTLCGGSKS